MATPYPGFRQHLRERLMRECTDRKIEERRQASENMQQEAVPEEVHEEGGRNNEHRIQR